MGNVKPHHDLAADLTVAASATDTLGPVSIGTASGAALHIESSQAMTVTPIVYPHGVDEDEHGDIKTEGADVTLAAGVGQVIAIDEMKAPFCSFALEYTNGGSESVLNARLVLQRA